MAFSRIAYDILAYLVDNKATVIMSAEAISEMMEDPKIGVVSTGTIYKIVNELWGVGLVAQGAKKGTANTYYITQAGIKHLSEALGVDESELMSIIESEIVGGNSYEK